MFVHLPFPNSYVDTLTPNAMVFLGLNEVRGGLMMDWWLHKKRKISPPVLSPGTEERLTGRHKKAAASVCGVLTQTPMLYSDLRLPVSRVMRN